VDQRGESKDGKPAAGNLVAESAAEDSVETSVFYQSLMSWKNLQEWAQRVWAKHYQQSPVGSTQNVKPVIFQAGLATECIPSATENSPSDQNVLTAETDVNLGYRDNLQPSNQHPVAVSQYMAPAKQNEASNVAAQPANRRLATANQNETPNVAAQLSSRSSAPANQNEASGLTSGRGSGHVCCQGDAVNKLNVRNQVDVESAIERDLQAAARHREKLSAQAKLEQTTKNSKKSRCTLMYLSLFQLI